MAGPYGGVLKGIASNPAAPSGVLLRLLAPEAEIFWYWLTERRELPPPVADAIVCHPDARLRADFARARHAAPARLARLVDDPSAEVRLALAKGRRRFREEAVPLPDSTYERLLADPEPAVRTALIGSPLPAPLRARFASDADPAARITACHVWERLTEPVRAALLRDPDPDIRQEAALNECVRDAALTARLLTGLTDPDDPDGLTDPDDPAGSTDPDDPDDDETNDDGDRDRAARRGLLDRGTAELIALHRDVTVRRWAAENPSLPADLVARLATDPDPGVRLYVSARPELTETERAAIDYTVDASARLPVLEWVQRAHENADVDILRRCAASAHPWLRRSAARSSLLPLGTAERLARDEDFAVRLLLCEFHPEPPPELLLRVYAEWHGRTRADLLDHPRFPRKGLAARFAEDPDPALRYLALRDPDAPSALVDRLTRDPDREVARAAAGHPRLPPERIRDLLADVLLVAYAAANPALPVDHMHRLLDEAGIPAAAAAAGPRATT
ncbi:hypothetical protein AB0O64_20685 [Streptomyces sp. NPDC088341]|uniref:hypothetical protein n=1 Tax=Streptomyces sp. NPDC088341 TaxID=3154870 RepID=UPI00342A3BD6